jgi:hypothetical protein
MELEMSELISMVGQSATGKLAAFPPISVTKDGNFIQISQEEFLKP